MPTRRLLSFALGLLVLVAGCASANKRLEQGMEAESQGRDEQAIARYVQALQKDPSLQEARSRLMQVGSRSVASRLDDAAGWSAQGDPLAAAVEYRRVDGMVASARSVNVRLDLPSDHAARRREAFDAANEALLAEGESARARARWSEGRTAFRRARTEFDPADEHRDAALTGESRLLLDWGHREFSAGHLRAAYDCAAAVHDLEWSPWEEHEAAADLMFRALSHGQVELMALPVVTSGRKRDHELLDLEVRINDALDRGAWFAPPPFIRLSDPIAVREVVRQAGALEGGLRAPVLGLLLRAIDADFGAWMELVEVDATEFEVKRTTKPVQTHAGEAASFVLEEGQRRVRAQARVIVVDRNGNEVTNLLVGAAATGPFRRGRYDGDPRELNLDRRDVDVFDTMAHQAQEQAVRQAVALDLSTRLGTAVIDPVLARIP